MRSKMHERKQSGDDARCAVVVATARHAIEMRAHCDERLAALPALQCHHQIARGVALDRQSGVARRSRNELVGSIF